MNVHLVLCRYMIVGALKYMWVHLTPCGYIMLDVFRYIYLVGA